MALYELALLGEPSSEQVEAIRTKIEDTLCGFKLTLGDQVSWCVSPQEFAPSQHHASAAAFLGAPGATAAALGNLIERGVPIIPVPTSANGFESEIPQPLRRLNGLPYKEEGPTRIATALLECAGLLPRQRRVFISYRRQEARQAALQLFDEFSARLFDVFLDTHGIAPGEEFQLMLWHRLCDSDVLVMIDTPGYFESRWTSAEFGRALAKTIAVLRVGWPGCKPSPRVLAAGSIDLTPSDLEADGSIKSAAISQICTELETRRSEGIAVRHLNLVEDLRQGIRKIGGTVDGVGLHRGIHIRLPDQRTCIVYPSIHIPSSESLQDAIERANGQPPAVLYDHIGLHARHLAHLDWLGKEIPRVQLVKACEAAWFFAGWGA